MYRTQVSIDSASTHAIANDIHSPGPASRAIVGKSEGIGGIVGLGFRPIAAPPWLAETGLEDAEVAGRLNRLMTSLAQHDQFSGVVQVQRSDRTIYAALRGGG